MDGLEFAPHATRHKVVVRLRRLVSADEAKEAISWRIGSDFLLWGCTYLITGSPKISLGVTGLYSVVSIVAYVPHARWWRRRQAQRRVVVADRAIWLPEQPVVETHEPLR